MAQITDRDIRQYLPNMFEPTGGDSTLSERLEPHMEAAQDWIARLIAPRVWLEEVFAGTYGDKLETAARRLTALRGMELGLPSLDLVFTNAGFGVVSTQSVAPASRERVERLLDSITALRNSAADAFLALLRSTPDWHVNAYLAPVRETFFLPEEMPAVIIPSEGSKYDRWEVYTHNWAAIRRLERVIETEAVGESLMRELREDFWRCTLPQERVGLVFDIKTAVADALRTDSRITPAAYMRIVRTLRSNPETFAAWHSSPLAEIWSPDVFRNTKKSGGYWF